MTKLEELEKRLEDEPDSLGLRVLLAGELHDAGRRADSIEMYRSAAIAYRDQGRTQQAITVCRSVLAFAPDDELCKPLLAQLIANRITPPRLPRPPLPGPDADDSGEPFATIDDGADPTRPSSSDVTPLPAPLPHHIAHPTLSSIPVVAPGDLPFSLEDELVMQGRHPRIAGIASAAREISATLISRQRLDDDDVCGELETRRLPRITADDLRKISEPPPVVKTAEIAVPRVPDLPELAEPPEPPEPPDLPEPLPEPLPDLPGAGASDGDDEPTLLPAPSDSSVDDEATRPREAPGAGPADVRRRPPSIAPPTTATGPLSGAFFARVPPRSRTAVLQRFRRGIVAAGTPVIERGETGHGLMVVVRGLLEIHAERADGTLVVVGAIAPGEYTGEASLLTRTPAPASAVAAVDSEVIVLSESDFYEVTGTFPALWIELKAVAERRAREYERLLG